jgi:dihydroxy-acid dehydratase
VQDGDSIQIDIPNRRIHLDISTTELANRRSGMEAKGKDAWKPAQPRPRRVTAALKAYALLATSADRGAVRNLEILD